MIFNRAFANTLLLAPSLAAAAVNVCGNTGRSHDPAANKVQLHYEVGGHKKESSVGVDECTNLNGLLYVPTTIRIQDRADERRGVSNFQTTGKCHLYTYVSIARTMLSGLTKSNLRFVDCIGAAVEAHRGPHIFSPPLIVGSIRCLEEDENADDTEAGAEELDE